MKPFIIALVALFASTPVMAQEKPAEAAKPRFEEAARFKADFARQGIAVDANHFYAVTDEGIAKHDKKPANWSANGKAKKKDRSSASIRRPSSMARSTPAIPIIPRSR